MHVCVCDCWPVIQPQQKQRFPLILVPTDSAEPPLASLSRAKPNWTHLCCKPELRGEPKRAALMSPARFCWTTTQTATLTTTKKKLFTARNSPYISPNRTLFLHRSSWLWGFNRLIVMTLNMLLWTRWRDNAGGFSKLCSNSGKFTSLLVTKKKKSKHTTAAGCGFVVRR